MANLNTIKSWFKTGLRPTSSQFSATWDSFVHKDDSIPVSKIENLDNRFSDKTDKEVFQIHEVSDEAHNELFTGIRNEFVGLSTMNFKGLAEATTVPTTPSSELPVYYQAEAGVKYLNFKDATAKAIEIPLKIVNEYVVNPRLISVGNVWKGIWELQDGVDPEEFKEIDRKISTKADLKEVILAKDYLAESVNIVNKNYIVSGQWALNSAGGARKIASDNWISIDFVPLALNITFVTVSGIKPIVTENLGALFFDENRLLVSSVFANNSNHQTFEKPVNARYLSLNLANHAEIGLKPTDNQYASTVMVNRGSDVMPYRPYEDGKISKEKVDFNFNNVALVSEVLTSKDYVSDSVNLIPKSALTYGQWEFSSTVGVRKNTSLNWLSIDFLPLSNDIQKITLGGFLAISTQNIGAVFHDQNKILISTEAANNGSTQTFTKPATAKYISLNLANVKDIGLNPSDNQYANSVMLNRGSVLLPYQPFASGKIKPDQINYPFEEVVKETSLEDLRTVQSWLKASYNLLDRNTLTSGQWILNSSNQPAKTTSVNWLSYPKTGGFEGNTEYFMQGVRTSPSAGLNNHRLLFWDVNNVYLSSMSIGQTGNSIEFSFVSPPNAYYFAANLANIVRIGERPTDNEVAMVVMINKGSKKPYEPFGTKKLDSAHITDFTPPTEGAVADLDKVIVLSSPDNLLVLYYTGGNANNWFGVGYKRFVNTTKFIDIWRLDTGKSYKRLSEFGFMETSEIIQTGVWENAIYTNDPQYDNALGSSHGWEMLNSLDIKLDGVALVPSTIGNFKCKELYIETKTNLVSSNGAIVRGISFKRWTISSGIINIKNTISWVDGISIKEQSYMGMCPVNRKSGDGSTQITNRAMKNPVWRYFDVSEPFFENDLTVKNNDTSTMVIEGRNVKVEMTILKALPLLPKRGFWLQNSQLYNKKYYQHGEALVKNGDVWDVSIDYRIFV